MGKVSRIVLRSYHELNEFIDIFNRGGSNLLIVVGDYGLGKSRIIKQALGQDCKVIENHATAYRLYQELFNHKDKTFLIDDVEHFYQNPPLLRLLKQLCNTEEVKTVSYHSNTKEIVDGDLPDTFATKTRVVIITNDFKLLNKHVGALADRGDVVGFEPTAKEVFLKVSEWCQDDEVLTFFEGYITGTKRFTMRDVNAALMKKKAGADWQRFARLKLGAAKLDELGIVGNLVNNAEMTEAERVAAFIHATGKSRATYFNKKAKLRDSAEVS